VEIDEAEEALVPLLVGHPAPNGTQVVAQVLLARRLDPGEGAGHDRRAGTGGSPRTRSGPPWRSAPDMCA
jgi:hypothetical protein